MGQVAKNFKPSEFQCSCGCGLNNAQLELIVMLQEFADRCDSSIIITSACRCKTLNDSIGSNDDSMHRLGIAADIQTPNCTHEHAVEIAKLMYNLNLIGGLILYKNFIHMDCRKYPYYKDKR